MNDISLFLSKDTVAKRKYLFDFFNRVSLSKLNGIRVNVYKMGMLEDSKFWSELYEDYPLPEEKCQPKNIRIGNQYQANI